jgi:iron(III) transport system permease protein
VVPRQLTGAQGALAAILCALPFAMGFVLPVAVMGGHALRNPQAWIAPDQLRALGNTLVSGGIAAVVTVGAALVLVYGLRLAGRAMPRWILPVTAIGYAAPGAVLALGILVPMAALDHRVADAILWVTGTDPGLLITGTAGAIILAYIVRFFGIAQGAVDAAFGRISPNLPLAARALGRGRGAVLREVYLPMMRGSVAVALLVVFVDCVKELPATLLLRPFNYNTLATRMQELASLERLGQAAPAALMVVAVSLVAVALVARMDAR